MIRQNHRWEDQTCTDSAPTPISFVRLKAWRDLQILAGQPSGLLDYYRASGFCIACQASGIERDPPDWNGDIPLFKSCKVCFGTGKVKVC